MVTPAPAVNHWLVLLGLMAVRSPSPPLTAIQVVPLLSEWLRSVAAEPFVCAPASSVPASAGCAASDASEVRDPSVALRL